jgi:hypothetical protein
MSIHPYKHTCDFGKAYSPKHVDAAYVEQVRARRQPPEHLPILHQAEAHRALSPPAPTAAALLAGAARR